MFTEASSRSTAAGWPGSGPTDISVIIPTLNESVTIAQTVQRTCAPGPCEINVVDGIPEMEVMVDLSLTWRRKREGQLRVVDHSLHVSPRRWQQMRHNRQTLRNRACVGLSHCGVSPRELARHYANNR